MGKEYPGRAWVASRQAQKCTGEDDDRYRVAGPIWLEVKKWKGWDRRNVSLENRREEAGMSYILSSRKKPQPWAVD